MDICHLKNAELEPKLLKYKGRIVLRGDIVEVRQCWRRCIGCCIVKNVTSVTVKAIFVIVHKLPAGDSTVLLDAKNRSVRQIQENGNGFNSFEKMKTATVKSAIIFGGAV